MRRRQSVWQRLVHQGALAIADPSADAVTACVAHSDARPARACPGASSLGTARLPARHAIRCAGQQYLRDAAVVPGLTWRQHYIRT